MRVLSAAWLTGASWACAQTAQYSISFPDPAGHRARVKATFPAKGDVVELFMPVWSPGYYKVEDYAAKVKDFTAWPDEGRNLTVDHPKPNRWIVHTPAVSSFTFTYDLQCDNAFVTSNWVGPDYAVLTGPATFVSVVGELERPCQVAVDLPQGWKRIATGLSLVVPDHVFTAPNYDVLVDCPIAAGNFDVRSFEVAGSRHEVVSLGALGEWDPQRATNDMAKFVAETRRFWGELPFSHYVFFLHLRPGGGGLEHLNSTLITWNPRGGVSGPAYTSFLTLTSHEYFHAFNVKRLRPVELGPFDYENPPTTPSLWVSEGLTSYYEGLIVCRAGLATREGCLQHLSSHITQLQNSPGRLLQSLEQASREVWTNSTSGIRTTDKTVSYYVKGPVVGFLLDARIRAATDGRQSLDDVMRRAYQLYSGARGFTPEEFVAVATEIAGTDLKPWIEAAVSTPGELEYAEALNYFGLSLSRGEGNAPWRLSVRDDATEVHRRRLDQWLGPEAK